MGRVKICGNCMRPLNEHDCDFDDEEITVDIEGLDGDDAA